MRFIDTSCLEPLSYLQLNCADCIDQLCKRYYILVANQQGLLFSDSSYQFHRELCQSVPETFPRSCAGADRLSSGMRGAFGKPYGTAARVDIGQVLISLRTKERLVKWSLGNDGNAHHGIFFLFL